MTSRLAPESGEHRFSVGTYTPTIKTPRGALVSPILLSWSPPILNITLAAPPVSISTWPPSADCLTTLLQVTTGKTPVLTGQEAATVFAACNCETLTGLRDQALFRVMLYTTSRISTLFNAKRGDYVKRSARAFLRQHEKGGVYREVPLHHQAERALDLYHALPTGRRQP